MVRSHDIHVPPTLVRNAVDKGAMLELRKQVRQRFGASDAEAHSFAERLLTSAVQRFGAKYLNEMAEHIERLFKLRERASKVVDEVLEPGGRSADSAAAEMEGIFRDIKSNMDAITGAEAFAKKERIEVPDDIKLEFDLTEQGKRDEARLKAEKNKRQNPLRSGVHAEQTSFLSGKFDRLPKSKRQAVRKAADVAPHELWRVVASETEGGQNRAVERLRTKAKERGMKESEIDALEDAARELSLERARSQRTAGTAEGFQRAEAVKMLVSKLNKALDEDESLLENSPLRKLDANARRKRLDGLRKLVDGDRYLERLAAENPKQLLELFEASGAKSRSALRAYIRRRMVTHIRGLLGEFTAAFRLGDEGVILLKGPDYNVTIPGTDLVGVTKDGKVWLIDNKALSAEELTSVTALTRNIATNISDDAAAFVEAFGRRRNAHIGDAVSRIDKARKAIRELTKGMDEKEIGSTKVQQQIADICKEHGIERVVTNAGGKVEGLSSGLKKAKIAFEDLNAPIADATTD